MAQFKATAGETYINSATGQKVTYTADQLKDPAVGFLSDQFKPYTTTPTVTQPTTLPQPTTQPVAQPTTQPTANPWFGIPVEQSSQMTSTEQAKAYWQDPATAQPTPAGVGMPAPTSPMGEYIPNEDALQVRREELAAAGVPESDWSKYISSPDAQGKLFYSRPATLISPTGEKKIVASGSTEANQLFQAGWTLSGQMKDGTVNAPLLANEEDIKIGTPQTNPTYLADTARASATEDTKTIDELIKYYQELLNPPETELSKQVSSLMGDLGESAESLTGRGAMQISEEEKRGIEATMQILASKNTELKKKLAEIDTLTKSYDIANLEEEGRPQTLSRLQGAQARNYKMYLAQKNMLTSEAGYIQAEILGLQGEIEAAQKAADRAVELEYMDRESAYNAKLAQLNILLPQLEKEEATYGNAVQLALQQQANALAEQKQNTKDIMSVKLEAISAGITDPSILSRIGSAKSYDEALQIYGENRPAGGDGMNELLTLTEAAKLGLPYGTTRGQAAALGITPSDDSSLTPAQINSTVNSIASAFDNEPIVKNYNTVQEGYQTISSIGVNTKSPADDIAFIYAFAKIMDPNSVVREGEYNTIQKYAQTWADNFGFTATRIFSNTNFLTADAKQKMLNALEPKVSTITSQYQNLEREYQRQINDAYAGLPRQITDYDKSFSSGSSLPAINQSYSSLEALLKENPSYLDTVEKMLQENPNLSDQDVLQILTFSDDLSMSQNYLSQYGTITGFGSPYWDKGLDVDLKIGDKVTSPVSGKVVYAGTNGGFGNQIQVKDSLGNIYMLSHLDSINVKVGDTVTASQLVGLGGNTGSVIPGPNGDGSHLDITVKKPDGSYYTAEEVYKMLA